MSLNTNNPMALRYLLEETLYPFSAEAPSVAGTQTPDKPMEEKIPFSFLGEHKQGLLYLITAPAIPFFSEQALDAFTKTNQALGYTLADIAVLNTASLDKTEVQQELLAFFSPKKIVFAGASPQELGFPLFPLNSIQSFEGIPVLYTYSFEEMLTDVQKKKTFWQTLKLL